MPYSTAYANDILNLTLGQRRQLETDLSRIYLALSTNDPEADGGYFEELTVPGYERVLIVRWESKYNSVTGKTEYTLQEFPSYFGAAENREIQNNRQINWNRATRDWPMVKGFGLFTKESNEGLAVPEEPFFYGKLDTELEVPENAVALFDPGSLKLTFPAGNETT